MSRRKVSIARFSLFGAVIGIFIIFCTDKAAAGDYLTGSGCSVSNVGYLTDLAKEYERRSGTRVLVRGGGSVVGMEDLRSGRVDFAASCRKKEGGDPEDIQFIQVAWDALTFITHKSNIVEDITLDEVRSVLTGKITNWKVVKGNDLAIRTFVSKSRKGLSGVESSIRDMVLRGKELRESPNVMFVSSTGIVEQMVEDTPGGFAVTGFTSARKRNVKMLKVNGVAPSAKNIKSRRYPLARPLFLLIPAEPRAEVKKFVDFVLSREGQHFISSLGVVSLSDLR